MPILAKLNEAYKVWHGLLIHLPKLTKHTLGTKVDGLFTDCLELSLLAGYTSRAQKLDVVQKLSAKFDSLKFFLKLLWELKALDNKKYAVISSPLNVIGPMIGGWLKDLKIIPNETPLA